MRMVVLIATLAFLLTASAHAQEGAVEFIAKQGESEDLASRLIGVTVKNPSGDTLGGVNDLLLDATGQVTGVVIGIGGFLGIAEKNVAVPYDSLTRKTESDDKVVLILNTTKEALQQAPDFLTADNKPLSITKRLREQAGELGERAKRAYEKAKETMMEGGKEGGNTGK